MFIQVIIVLTSLKLVTDTYQDQFNEDAFFNRASLILDSIFTEIFVMEALTKSIALGFFMDEKAYLRETWNWIDFIISISSLLDQSLSSVNIPVIKILRLLRILRPLRFISVNNSIKIIITTFLESVSSIFNTIIMILIIWLMFAILGVSLFSGKFFYCFSDNAQLILDYQSESYPNSFEYLYTDEKSCI